MLARKLKKDYSFEDYLELEERSHVRHEFHEGEVFAMAGETANHSQICTNFLAELRTFFRNKPCRVYGSSMKVRIQNDHMDKSLYPDATVTCDSGDQGEVTFIKNPKVIFEVLSKSTENYDRIQKFRIYRECPSLENYVLVDQTKPMVEVFTKTEKYQWNLHLYPEGSILIPSIDFTIPLNSLYEKVVLPH